MPHNAVGLHGLLEGWKVKSLGGLQSRVGLDNMEKWKFLTLPGLELIGHPARRQSLYWLSYGSSVREIAFVYFLMQYVLCIKVQFLPCFAQFVCVLHVAGKPRYDLGSNEEVEYFGKGKFTYVSAMLVT
jgi:hypothetical protein